MYQIHWHCWDPSTSIDSESDKDSADKERFSANIQQQTACSASVTYAMGADSKMKHEYRASTATVTTVLPAPKAETPRPTWGKLLKWFWEIWRIIPFRDNCLLPSAIEIQIVATGVIIISKTSQNAVSVSSSCYTDSDIASQRFPHDQERLLFEKMRKYRWSTTSRYRPKVCGKCHGLRHHPQPCAALL